jgi:hypothetical protein
MTQALAQGELLYVTDTQRIYVGNGSTLGGISVTGYTDLNAQDAAAQIFTSGAHSGIGFSYNTATNTMTATVDLSNYTGTIDAASFRGSLVADDSTLLVDAVDGKINLNGTIFSNVVPDTNIAYDVGTPSFRFRNLYVEGGGLINSALVLGSASITANGTAVNLPAGSTIGGIPIGAGGDDYFGNIIGNDSSVMINTSTYVITAAGGFVGNLTGNASTSSVATTVALTATTTSPGTNYLTFVDSATGNETIRTDTDLTYNPGTNTLTSVNFSGNLTGNVTGDVSGTAGIATTVSLTATNTDFGSYYLTFVDSATGNETVRTDTDLSYNPGTNTLTAVNFSGNVSGNVTGNLTGTADVATAVTLVATNTTIATHYLTFVDTASGNESIRTDTDLLYNPGTNTLTAVNFSGNLLGDVSGNVIGDLRGSVVGDDSTPLIDGVSSLIVGNIQNIFTDTDIYTGRTISLAGTSSNADKAGIRIDTDGNADDTYDLFTLNGAKAAINGMSVVFERSRGTLTSRAALQSGDEILGMFWFGTDTDVNPQVSGAIIVGVDAAPSSGAVPGFMEISTADSTGTPVPAIRIDSEQVIEFANNTLIAGVGSGQVDNSSVSTYLEIKVNGTTYGVPLYAVNP